VLFDHKRHHFKIANFLGGDVLQHIAEASVLGVEELGEVGQGRSVATQWQLPRRTRVGSSRESACQAERDACHWPVPNWLRLTGPR
jgi:hypothetical protein